MDKLAKDLINAVDQAFNLTDREHMEILRMYNQSRNNIRQFMADMYMKYGLDGQIDFSEFQRLHMAEVEEYIVKESNAIARKELLLFPIILGGALALTYNKSAYHLEQGLKVGINFNLLRQEFIDTTVNYNWSGVSFSERIWSNQEALVKSLRQELTQGLQQGESLDKMARRIDKQFNSKAYESQRLMRTESARVITDAQEQIYKDTGVIEEVMWVATLEEGTCDECEELDNERFRLDDSSKPHLPAHPNCKCCWVGIPFDDYKPSKRKDNETKEIIEYKSFKQWKEDKGVS